MQGYDDIQQRSREIFRTEAAELLAELEAALLELENRPDDAAAIHRVFRVLHTLKGSGATSGFPDLSDFLHRVEDVFCAARDNRLRLTPEMIDLALQVADAVTRHLAAPAGEARGVLEAAQGSLEGLLRFLPDRASPAPAAPPPASPPPAPSAHRYSISFRPRPHFFLTGSDPGVFLDDLRALGDCAIQAAADDLPPLDDLDAEQCHLGWNIRLTCTAGEPEVRDVFAFVTDDCELEVLPWRDEASPPAAPVAAAPAATAAAPAGHPRSTIDNLRVSADRLDRLVNMVGELVILRAQVGGACSALREVPPVLQAASEGLDRLTKELRDVVLEIRMMPVGELFRTFRRLCRDLARDLGKEVELVIEGAETEMDKTVLEQLKDPLVHLVRNSLDHGLEPPAERLRDGKSRAGTLRLAAEQRGDRVWITVSDDGRGLDTARIREKAVARGLLAADARAGDAEIQQLVFLPGFSTADSVSKLSGRGVGLDVVKRQMELLRGAVELRSRPGAGTEFRLAVPLTLAIIEGLMVQVDGDRFILPLAAAEETIQLTPATRARAGARNLVELRGELVPCLRLRDVFDSTSAAPEREHVVIVECEGQRLGFVVDRVLGNHQTVIKTLGWLGRHVSVFSGATVLGDGRIGLICDVPALVAYAAKRRGVGTGLEV